MRLPPMNNLWILVAALGGLSAALGPLPAQSWVQMTAPSTNIGPVACSADGDTLVAGEGANVWVSTNSGATFGLAYTLGPAYVAGGGDRLRQRRLLRRRHQDGGGER